ncbi:hypothetical protein BpHYR1_040868 [Brachionus plicatilis]|uniref:Uncharacterized protein n=1 Tax=Brachionus plicatilis TaxID=10195 RepID=A0A3M7QML2_BRAPC|nr:hypothetical protein BpHYR1_040868 [Brachionus plicatilis]
MKSNAAIELKTRRTKTNFSPCNTLNRCHCDASTTNYYFVLKLLSNSTTLKSKVKFEFWQCIYNLQQTKLPRPAERENSRIHTMAAFESAFDLLKNLQWVKMSTYQVRLYIYNHDSLLNLKILCFPNLCDTYILFIITQELIFGQYKTLILIFNLVSENNKFKWATV